MVAPKRPDRHAKEVDNAIALNHQFFNTLDSPEANCQKRLIF